MKAVEIVEKLDQLTATQANQMMETLAISEQDLRAIKKILNEKAQRDDKAFMDMLRTINRNHYLLNQMVDRKARIMLSAAILLLSIIIGGAISLSLELNWRFYLLGLLGLSCLLSSLAAMIAVLPERSHGELTHEDIRSKKGNPLFFGNFKNLSEEEYENTMLEMVNDRDFVYRSMIQDIYHLGQVLERKRKFLRFSLYIFILGLCLTMLLAFTLNIVLGV